ncbi:hypothetical protein [Anaeromyxobacter diazotrophicus]|uniref:Uncharacterized protein n=1 Tax=Anaeromyxobacter diazotrophicus TaxID=2590199 RepID=A0A7I9VMX7_9BACT|nr:hypothetical protein [Anaeromyxobacter diazotrophicus]GEJ57754.1 hypothetical protein AMYX_24950 [Anaeromyxobacter diazotrophicus]
MKQLVPGLAVSLLALAAGPAFASNDRPPDADDAQPRATWTFDQLAEQPVPNDDTTYAVAAHEAAPAQPGFSAFLVALPVGDGGPGEELRGGEARAAAPERPAQAAAQGPATGPSTPACGC